MLTSNTMNFKIYLSLLRNTRTESIRKGDILIKQGSTKKDIFFIKKGLIRSFFINEKIDEITFHLFPEYQIFTNVHTFLFDEPSKFFYQAVEDTKVYVIDYDAYNNLVTENPNLLELNRRFLGRKVLKQAFFRIESFVLLSPEERYLKYVEEYPTIINRAPDKYIANVLGITPVSLSRIRKRISTKKH